MAPGTVAVVLLGDAMAGQRNPLLLVLSACFFAVGITGLILDLKARGLLEDTESADYRTGHDIPSYVEIDEGSGGLSPVIPVCWDLDLSHRVLLYPDGIGFRPSAAGCCCWLPRTLLRLRINRVLDHS